MPTTYDHAFPHPGHLREARTTLVTGFVSTDEVRALMLAAVQAYRHLVRDRKARWTPDEVLDSVWRTYRASFAGEAYKAIPVAVDLDDLGFQVVAQFVSDALERLDAYDIEAGVYVMPDQALV